jgi:hypothetical protein
MSVSSNSKKFTLDIIESRGKLLENLRYGSTQAAFLPAKSVNNNIIYTEGRFQRFHDCREIIIGEIRSLLAEKREIEGKNFTGFPRLNYVVGFSARNKNESDRCQTIGMRILHAFEKILACRPSHAFAIDTIKSARDGKSGVKNAILFLVSADKPWVKSPEMLSLHLLLLRLSTHECFSVLKHTPLGDIPNKMKSVAEKVKTKDEDIARVVLHTDAWVKILKEYDKRFGKKKFTTTFLLDHDGAESGALWEDGIDVPSEKISGKDIYDYIDNRNDYDEDYYYDEDDD